MHNSTIMPYCYRPACAFMLKYCLPDAFRDTSMHFFKDLMVVF